MTLRKPPNNSMPAQQSVAALPICTIYIYTVAGTFKKNTFKNFTHIMKTDKHTIHFVGHLLHRCILYSFSEKLFSVKTRSFWIIKFYSGLWSLLSSNYNGWYQSMILTFMWSQCFSHNSEIQWSSSHIPPLWENSIGPLQNCRSLLIYQESTVE